MKIYQNHILRKYNYLRINAIAEKFFVPENEGELISLMKRHKQCHIIGGGTNILIDDCKPLKNPVIYMGEINMGIKFDENSRTFTVGASERIQKVIDFINEKGYGGFEYLYHLPGAMMGGVAVMNAGLDRNSHKQIAEFIVSVTVFDGDKIKILKKDEIFYEYRNSIIHKKKWIVTEVVLECPLQDKEDSKNMKKKRIEQAKQFDHSAPNVGSVFSLIHFNTTKLSKYKIGGARYSDKTQNWLLNTDGKATFRQFMILINIARVINMICKFKIAHLEVDIIKE
jgi:UDP-N-acetylmuramate dehydrogenase